MKLSKDARKMSKQLFRASFDGSRLDSGRVRTIANQIATSKPRNFVGILKEYQRLIRLEVEKHHARIESAAPLDQAAIEQLQTNLRAQYGDDLSTEFHVTPELIGGLRIKVGSDVWDSSVRNRLERLKDDLSRA
jgi:F-type H+-transporting ATPase subunit delta